MNDGDPMPIEMAEYYCRLEAATCICSPDATNDDCGWHGQQIWRDIEDGSFWTNGKTYSKPATPAPPRAGE